MGGRGDGEHRPPATRLCIANSGGCRRDDLTRLPVRPSGSNRSLQQVFESVTSPSVIAAPRHPVTSTSSAHLVPSSRAVPASADARETFAFISLDHVVGTAMGSSLSWRERPPEVAGGRSVPGEQPTSAGQTFHFQLRRSDGRFPASVRRSRRPWTSRLQPQHVDDERCASPRGHRRRLRRLGRRRRDVRRAVHVGRARGHRRGGAAAVVRAVDRTLAFRDRAGHELGKRICGSSASASCARAAGSSRRGGTRASARAAAGSCRGNRQFFTKRG